MDVVFDQYTMKEDLKMRQENLEPNVSIPKSFNTFLARNQNKEELFDFVAENLVKLNLPFGKQVICTGRSDQTMG
jgi:hypothetical protein